jgi:hypothetical protein
MKWVTRARPKVDRVACPWLIKRFVDPDAQFLYVPADQVLEAADRENAILIRTIFLHLQPVLIRKVIGVL